MNRYFNLITNALSNLELLKKETNLNLTNINSQENCDQQLEIIKNFTKTFSERVGVIWDLHNRFLLFLKNELKELNEEQIEGIEIVPSAFKKEDFLKIKDSGPGLKELGPDLEAIGITSPEKAFRWYNRIQGKGNTGQLPSKNEMMQLAEDPSSIFDYKLQASFKKLITTSQNISKNFFENQVFTIEQSGDVILGKFLDTLADVFPNMIVRAMDSASSTDPVPFFDENFLLYEAFDLLDCYIIPIALSKSVLLSIDPGIVLEQIQNMDPNGPHLLFFNVFKKQAFLKLMDLKNSYGVEPFSTNHLTPVGPAISFILPKFSLAHTTIIENLVNMHIHSEEHLVQMVSQIAARSEGLVIIEELNLEEIKTFAQWNEISIDTYEQITNHLSRSDIHRKTYTRFIGDEMSKLWLPKP